VIVGSFESNTHTHTHTHTDTDMWPVIVGSFESSSSSKRLVIFVFAQNSFCFAQKPVGDNLLLLSPFFLLKSLGSDVASKFYFSFVIFYSPKSRLVTFFFLALKSLCSDVSSKVRALVYYFTMLTFTYKGTDFGVYARKAKIESVPWYTYYAYEGTDF
jgi:hypothetical protein